MDEQEICENELNVYFNSSADGELHNMTGRKAEIILDGSVIARGTFIRYEPKNKMLYLAQDGPTFEGGKRTYNESNPSHFIQYDAANKRFVLNTFDGKGFLVPTQDVVSVMFSSKREKPSNVEYALRSIQPKSKLDEMDLAEICTRC